MNGQAASSAIDLAHEAQFELGELRVRPSTREVVIGERRQTLEPRVMQVLVALARRHGAVVSREDLFAACWGGRTVGEESINRCIGAIRRLAETYGGFSVTTVARVGYRLASTGMTKDLGPEPVLAVLPFDNLSTDPEMQFFSDGVSQEILDTVARGSNLRVIAPSSSFQFRGAEKAVRRVAADLKVTHLLDGSVRRAGSRVRISAHLVNCADETTLWSNSFDRELTDVFALQDEIAAAVAAALKIAFMPPAARPDIDPAVRDLFMRARARLEFVDIDKAAQTLGMLEEVVSSAPDFASAWAWLAFGRAVTVRVDSRAAAGLGVTSTSAREAANIALGFDDRSIMAYLALGYLEPFGRFAAREAHFRTALEMSPNDPRALITMALFCFEVGRHAEALEFARQAYDLDPLKAHVADAYGVMLTYGPGCDERFEDCRALWRDFVLRWPDNDGIAYDAIAAAVLHSDWDSCDALIEAQKPRISNSRTFQGLVWSARNQRQPDPEDLARALDHVRRGLGLTGDLSLGALFTFAQLGMIDEVFDLVDRASFKHVFDEPGTSSGSVSPGIVFYRGNSAMLRDTRFVSLCAKLGLCAYWMNTGRWPDCAEEDSLPYDFKSECMRLAAE